MQNRKFNAKLSYAKQSDIDTTPPYSMKQITRVVNGKEHFSTWTLRMGYFRYGEQVKGEFCKNDLKPSVHFTWSTAINRIGLKDNSSEIIYSKEEFENQIEFFGETTKLGQHFRKFANLYFEEWDYQLVKWCRHHLKVGFGLPPRNCEPYILELASQSNTHLPNENDF